MFYAYMSIVVVFSNVFFFAVWSKLVPMEPDIVENWKEIEPTSLPELSKSSRTSENHGKTKMLDPDLFRKAQSGDY